MRRTTACAMTAKILSRLAIEREKHLREADACQRTYNELRAAFEEAYGGFVDESL